MTAEPLAGGETFDDVMAEWEATMRARLRPSTIGKHLGTTRRFAEALGRDPRTATAADVTRWLDSQDLEAQSRTNYRSDLSAFWSFLVRTDRARTNVVHQLMAPPTYSAAPNLNHLVPDAAGNLWDTFAAWRRAQLASGCSEDTVRFRERNVRCFGRWAGVDPRFASSEDVVEYLARDISRTSKSVYAKLLRTWFEFLAATGVIAESPMVGMKLPKPSKGIPHPISEDDLARALKAAETYGHPHVRGFILLGAFHGLRCLEIGKVDGRHFDHRAGTHRIRGKGDVTRVVPLHPLVAELAESYPARSPWFPSRTRSGHIVSNTVGTVLSQFFAAQGIHATAHDLRHRFGTQVLRAAGGNVRVAQELLGHANPGTTAIYTQVSSDERSAAVLALPVPAPPSD